MRADSNKMLFKNPGYYVLQQNPYTITLLLIRIDSKTYSGFWSCIFSKALLEGFTWLLSMAVANFFPLPVALDTISDAWGSDSGEYNTQHIFTHLIFKQYVSQPNRSAFKASASLCKFTIIKLPWGVFIWDTAQCIKFQRRQFFTSRGGISDFWSNRNHLMPNGHNCHLFLPISELPLNWKLSVTLWNTFLSPGFQFKILFVTWAMFTTNLIFLPIWYLVILWFIVKIWKLSNWINEVVVVVVPNVKLVQVWFVNSSKSFLVNEGHT